MNRPLPGSDTKPWYRQFWPWFLIALPACVVVAGITTAIIANRHADDLVVDDYYKTGLAINRHLEKKQLAARLGITAQLGFSNDLVTVKLSGAVDDTSLQLQLSHPIEADRDFSAPLTRIASGLYQGGLAHKVAPHWHWSLGNNTWQLDGTVQSSEFGHAPLD